MCLANAPQCTIIDELYSDAGKDLGAVLDNELGSITTDSNYFSLTDELNINAGDYGLSLMHINVQSLPSKIDDLKILLENLADKGHPIDILLICETFLTDGKVSSCQIDSYTLVETHRSHRRGGGVAIYINKNIKFEERLDLQIFIDGQIESHFIEIELNKKPVIIGEIYRVPSSDLDSFFEKYTMLLEKINSENKTLILGTDQNIDYLKIHDHGKTANFLDLNLSSGLLPMITRPTRITYKSATLIDNIYTNDINHVRSAILLSDISDHLPCCLFFGQKTKYAPLKVTTRKLNDKKVLSIKNHLSNIDWEYIEHLNTDQAYEAFMQEMTNALDIYAPKRVITVSPKNVIRDEWMTNGLLKSSKTCNRLYKQQLGQSRNSTKYTKYAEYRNEYNRLKRHAKRSYYSIKIEEFRNDSKKLWGLINKAISKSRNKMDLPIKIKDVNDLYIYGSKSIANAFCSFFTNVGPNLASTIPTSSKPYNEYVKDISCNDSLFMSPTDEMEVYKIISHLKNKTSSGYDEINNILLKQLGEVVSLPLSKIFNKSITEGIFPKQMKLADIVPIYKSKDRLSCTNYRPVSLLPVVSKVLERIIYKRLYHHLLANDLLYNSQYGFRNKHSTANAVTEFVGKVLYGFEKEECTLGMFLDLSKAFDTIDHKMLLEKLEKYGVRGLANSWFRSYLGNRWQQVKYTNKIRSDPLAVQCGVPQGSVLGPLLFIIYTNDIYMCLKSCSCILFADDTTVYISGKDQSQLSKLMMEDMKRLTDWFRANKLSLNLSKTNAILFRPKGVQLNQGLYLKFGNEVIEFVSETKFLGMTIDEHLTWLKHITKVRLKISSSLFMLRNVRNLVSPEIKRMLYMSLLNSHMVYGLLIWGPMSAAGERSKIYKQQKKAVRIIHSAKFNAHASPLFKKYEILAINDLILLELGKFMFSYVHGDLPSPLLKLFESNSEFHNYNTRGRHDAITPKFINGLTGKSYLVKGPSIWTGLSYDLKHSPSMKNFTKKYREAVLSVY